MNKILVVDDDPYIRELVSKILQNEGFDTCEAVDGRDAFVKLGENMVDLIILDVMMPNLDGIGFCEKARKYYEDLPILMLTAKGETHSKIKGFYAGTDDYMLKPFEAAELLARVKALLRRYKIVSAQNVSFGKILMDKDSYTVEVAGEKQELPMKEFELLFALGASPGKTIPRQRLLDDIWGFDFNGNERTLDVHINRLRERFDETLCGFRISTVRGLGYRLEILQ